MIANKQGQTTKTIRWFWNHLLFEVPSFKLNTVWDVAIFFNYAWGGNAAQIESLLPKTIKDTCKHLTSHLSKSKKHGDLSGQNITSLGKDSL